LVRTDFPLEENLAGRDAAVDARSGVFYLEPDGETRRLLEEKLSLEKKEAALLDMVRGLPTVTKSGKSIQLISSVWEIRLCRELALEARSALESAGIAVGNVPLGIMIETPAAAILARSMAEEAEFFSVGTNDLTQYVLAADRQNSKLEAYTDPHHQALLTLLAHIARAAKDAGIEAGICGELASDPELTGQFMEMGFTELSVSPAYILSLRKHIREMD
jgi:phosphoenolpyruvate-protein kinase (PTS system EI component)